MPVLVSFEMPAASILSSVLGAILLDKGNPSGSISFNAAGLRITVERAKCIQGRAYVRREFLEQYRVGRPDRRDDAGRDADDQLDGEDGNNVNIGVNLPLLHRCLTVFGEKSSHLELSYNGYGTTIDIILEDDGIISQCQLQTDVPPISTNFHFRSVAIVSRAILKSSFLKDALLEMDVPGASTIEMTMCPDAPFLKFSAQGNSVLSDVEFPNDPDIFSVFECSRPITYRYSIQLFRPTIRALLMADQTNLKVNETGLLMLQHRVDTSGGPFQQTANVKNWVEFILVPDTEL